MTEAKQDLTAYPNLSRGTFADGKRWFSGWLPVPAWTKHNRTVLTARPGFRPLSTPGKKYQQFVMQAVLVNEFPALPWLREGSEYILEVITFSDRMDNDQFTGGLQDDFVKSTLLANDKHCEATVSRRVRTEGGENRVYIAGYETEKVHG